MNDFSIHTTVEHIGVGMTIVFINGMVGQRITAADFDERTKDKILTEDEEMAIEEGAVPFLNHHTGLVFLIPGDAPAVLKPDPIQPDFLKPAIPQAFTDAFDDEEVEA